MCGDNKMYTVEQYFNIQSISIENLANSSVFQIGTSGVIQSQSHVINPPQPLLPFVPQVGFIDDQFVVPLPNPT
jgi:hypothetical protein